MKTNLKELTKKYEDTMDSINILYANGDLGKLYELRGQHDYYVFDYFFDGLREKYNDPDFEKTNKELLKELDDKDLEEYIAFLENYIDVLEGELQDLKDKDKDEVKFLEYLEMELKRDLLGKEGTLVEIDNAVQAEIDTSCSIFDGDTTDVIRKGEKGYKFWKDEEAGEIWTLWVYIDKTSEEDRFEIVDIAIDNY